MVQSEGNMSLKNPVTPPGIGAGTIRQVAQRLNHYANPGPNFLTVETKTRFKIMFLHLKLTHCNSTRTTVTYFCTTRLTDVTARQTYNDNVLLDFRLYYCRKFTYSS